MCLGVVLGNPKKSTEQQNYGSVFFEANDFLRQKNRIFLSSLSVS